MYKITKIMTDDGNCFDSDKEAKKYLEKQYGNLLTKTANQILNHDKYTILCQFLDENLHLFKGLIELKNELKEPIAEED